MANRAYLYLTDDISALTFEQRYERRDGGEREYLDSRHQLPLAWLLFFGPEDVLLVSAPKLRGGELYIARLERGQSRFRAPYPAPAELVSE